MHNNMRLTEYGRTFVTLFAASVFNTVYGKTECLVEKAKGWFDPDNVYTCDGTKKCCQEYGKPSCCASKPTYEIVEEQFLLWGSLVGFLLLLALILFCRRNDVKLCDKKYFRWCPGQQNRVKTLRQNSNMA